MHKNENHTAKTSMQKKKKLYKKKQDKLDGIISNEGPDDLTNMIPSGFTMHNNNDLNNEMTFQNTAQTNHTTFTHKITKQVQSHKKDTNIKKYIKNRWTMKFEFCFLFFLFFIAFVFAFL